MKSPPAPRVLAVSFTRAGETAAVLEVLREGGLVASELSLRGVPPAAQPGSIRKVLRQCEPDVLLLVLAATESRTAGAVPLTVAAEAEPAPPVVIAAEFARAEEILAWLEAGAAEFLTLPLHPREAATRLTLLARQRPAGDPAVARLRAKLGLSQLIGENAGFARLVAQLPRIARSESSVLLMGETGTGKELFARAVHYLSRRAGKPFVPVNCGATPADLLENEFFGHESGAFTSAGTRRGGVIQEANGGTLFLDEVDCLPPFAQVKLLRFLQDGRFRPLGAGRESSADVRIVAASNADLADAQAGGRFRKDLYYRLNVIPLTLPPLRERPEDIPLLACHFAAKYAGKGVPVGRSLSRAALQKLLGHDWPGNVRELENTIERAVALAEQPLIGPADIAFGGHGEPAPEPGFQARKAEVVRQFEREYLQALLRTHEGNITKAAESARKDRRAFWELLRKHGLCLAIPARSASAPRPAAH